MTPTRIVLGLATLAFAAEAAAAAAQPATPALATTPGLQLKPITTGPRAGQQHAEQAFHLLLGESRYRLRYLAFLDPAKPDRALPGEGYIGMPGPSLCNWYHGGFLFVRINGRDIGGARLHSATVAESGPRAIVDLVWDAAAARVRCRFVGLGGDDKLLCEVAIEPKGAVRDLRLLLRCYPSFFTAWHKRDGARRVATPTRTVEQGQRIELPAAQHWRAVYYDTVFDVARGEGDGPCAALWLPEQVQTVKLDVGSYAVTTELRCRPDARAVRIAFWDLRQQANAPVLERFARDGKAWAAQLRRTDLTPAGIRSFNPEAELATLAGLTRSAAARRQLGARAEAFRKRIEALAKGRRPFGILEQARLLASMADYREFLWELRLADLLAD